MGEAGAFGNQNILKAATMAVCHLPATIKAEMWRDHVAVTQEQEAVPYNVTGRETRRHSPAFACIASPIGLYRKCDYLFFPAPAWQSSFCSGG
jgi:hypothetical protein